VAEDSILQAVYALGGTAISTLASIAAMVRRYGRRIDNLETRAIRLEAGLKEVDEAAKKLEGFAAASFKARASNKEAFAHIEKDFEALRIELRAARATSSGDLAEHIAAEAERWSEVHRTLGQIEGMMSTVRDSIRRPR
jgi:chromosome segregation ATPase